MIVSSVFLFLGLWRLSRLTADLDDYVINKRAILLLLTSSVFLIFATLGLCYFGARSKDKPLQFGIMQDC